MSGANEIFPLRYTGSCVLHLCGTPRGWVLAQRLPQGLPPVFRAQWQPCFPQYETCASHLRVLGPIKLPQSPFGARDNNMTKGTFGRKGFIILSVNSARSRNLKAETETGSMKKCFLLAPSPWLAELVTLYHLGPLTGPGYISGPVRKIMSKSTLGRKGFILAGNSTWSRDLEAGTETATMKNRFLLTSSPCLTQLIV